MSKKICIVDDDDEILNFLSKRLSQEGYEIIASQSGKEAIKKIKEILPKLILMDIVLPDIDGAEVVKILQDDQTTQRIPILFLSGIVTKVDGNNLQELKVGQRLYRAIAKPFQYEELLKTIKEII